MRVSQSQARNTTWGRGNTWGRGTTWERRPYTMWSR